MLGQMGTVYLSEEFTDSFPGRPHHFTFPSSTQSPQPHMTAHSLSPALWILLSLVGVKLYLTMVSIHSFLMTNDVKHLFDVPM